MTIFSKYNLLGKLKNYPLLFVANLSSSVSQWLILTFIAKIYGTENLGSYALVIAFTIPLYAFFSFQLRNVYVSDQSNFFDFNVLFTIRILCALLLFAGLIFIGAIYYKPLITIFLMIGLSKIFEMLSDIIHAYFHRKQQITTYCKQILYRSALSIILNIIFFLTFKSFQIALLSLPISYLIILLFDIKLLIQNHTIAIAFKFNNVYKKLIITGIFSGVSLFLVYMLPNIPRFFLEKFNGKYDLGIYSGYLSLIIFSRIFVQSITQISLPKLSSCYDQNNFNQFFNIIKKESIVIIIIGSLQFLIIPFSDLIFPIIFNRDFKSHHEFLIIIFFGSFFSFLSFVFNNALNAMKMFNIQLPIYFISSCFAILLSIKIIPEQGLYGAGIVFTATCAVQFISLLVAFILKANDKVGVFKYKLI